MEIDDIISGRGPVGGENRGAFVVTASERRGVAVVRQILDLTTTPVSVTFAGGVTQAIIKYSDLGSAVGDWIWVVFDALSDSDAATKLADPEVAIRILIGEDFPIPPFDPATPCYRMDFASNVASETGDSVVRILAKGVAA